MIMFVIVIAIFGVEWCPINFKLVKPGFYRDSKLWLIEVCLKNWLQEINRVKSPIP